MKELKNKFFIGFLLTLQISCGQSQNTPPVYPENVGDISFDSNVDDPEFKVCNENRTFQYYNSPKGFPYEGEKISLIRTYRKEFEDRKFGDEAGYVTIRFIVNCEGKTGRFRVQEMDTDFRAKTFNAQLTSLLLKTTKSLDGWIVASNGVDKFDYYQYLTFKIERGTITEILP